DARVEPTAGRRTGAERVHAVSDQLADIHALERLLEKPSKLGGTRAQTRVGHQRNVVPQRRAQPHTLCRLRPDADPTGGHAMIAASFQSLLQGFSPNAYSASDRRARIRIAGYRDTFRLPLRFAADQLGK